ncbi:suppressor of ascus dominance 2 [Neurospora tetrasperma FGSC 2508]|uniref:Suppressor of ascus dominance 2 n=1 Tax=Neurospora tetrasperma (strain FGSC 2508 / ATCC MYA-4615 / P0657) TaxID=510951 RepID=F8MBF2_NEUT8|nr:suppressor of ascus dominance 2 [Neurospora tetrasperma FGSC 2508]EGO60264.1 suppressor of ascus dominance 2 [Neurospora tetrasperma FGSC 2508]EGZ75772.1 suppressor of ascus dominance 2 [Neurospora tetrasperma FGSC 2509]
MTDRDKSGQSAADEEEQRRKAILAKAMMDDLGTARVENLPLEDVDLPPRHGRHDGRGHSRLTMPRPAPAVSDIWAEAQRQGVFNDDDAIAVRELDDLGGGRIYATRQQEVSALASRLVRGVRDHAQKVLNPELDSRLAKQYHGRGREIPPSRKINIGKDMKTSTLGVLHHASQPVRQFPPNYRPSSTSPRPLTSTKPLQQVSSSQGLSSSRVRVASCASSTPPFKETCRTTSVHSTRHATISQGPRHPPVNQAQTQPGLATASTDSRQSSARIRQPSTPTTQGPASQQLLTLGNEHNVPPSENESSPLSPELSNVLFKCEVDFPNSTRLPNRTLVPSMVYLSAAGKPHLGFFTLTCEGKQVCQSPISQYYHHTIDSGSRQLIIIFRGQEGYTSSHIVNFMAYMDAEDFHRTLACLRAGKYLDQVNDNSRQMLEATIQEAAPTTGEASPTPTPRKPVSQARAEQAITTDFDTVSRQPYAPNSTTTQRAENQEILVDTLIDLDTLDDAPSTVQPQYAQSEAAELLSTLDPFDYELEYVDDQLQLQQAQPGVTEHNYGLDIVKQEFVDTYRLLLQNMIKVLGEMPSNRTNRGASTMIEGLQTFVTNQAMTDECGLDESTKRELLKEVWGDSQPVDTDDVTNDIQSAPNSLPDRPETPRPPPQTAKTTSRETTRAHSPVAATHTRRHVYQLPFLVSLYDNRLQPPHWLSELGFMPAFSRRNQPPSTCQSLEATLTATRPATPLPAATILAPDFTRSRANHAWVMATEASETVEPTPIITFESTTQGVQAETQVSQIREPTSVVPNETTASLSHEEHVNADICSEPELISLVTPKPPRPPPTQMNVRGLRNSLWARPDDRLETEGVFTGPQFLTSATLRARAQLDPQAPVSATPAELAEMFSGRPSTQSIEHVTPHIAPGVQNDGPISVSNHRPATPADNTSNVGGPAPQDRTPLSTQRVVNTPIQQPSSVITPPAQSQYPVISSSLSNHSLASSGYATSSMPESSSKPGPPQPEQSASSRSSTNPGLAGSRFASSSAPENSNGTDLPVVQAQSPAPVFEAQPTALAPRPINRGLAGSRFASGKVLSSSGIFTGHYARTQPH